MKRTTKYTFEIFVFVWFVFLIFCYAEKIRLYSPERPVLTYYNSKYISYLNISSHRYGRNNPVYYGNINMKTLWEAHNNVTISLYLYQLGGNNNYYRSFVDVHYKLCDLIHKDQFIGALLRRLPQLQRPCPYPAGEYNLANISMNQELIPSFVPMVRGRVMINTTGTYSGEIITEGYIDIEIREINKKH